MIRIVYLLIASTLLNVSISAQNDKDIALTINGKPVLKSELQKEFDKTKTISEVGQNQTINEFIDGYLFHALVLEEARSLQIDTTKIYKDELASYKLQLINSFLKDTITEKELVMETVNRFEEELQVNQIFIPFDSTLLLPSDTVAPYQRALKARDFAIKKGFDKVEPEEKSLTYGVVLDVERETGELGWVRPFMFSYKLDEVLYSLQINEVTMPIRSNKGYHVLQVTGRRPAQGNPVVEQVIFNFPVIPADQRMQDSIYNVAMKAYEEVLLKDDFQTLCDEFSLAYDRGEKGCMLGEVNMGDQIPGSIIKAAFEMKEVGEVSKPILSAYGWHILRLKEIKPAQSKAAIMRQVVSLMGSDKIYSELLARQRMKMQKANNVEINAKAYNQLYALVAKYSSKTEEFENKVTNKSEELINIDNKKSYTVDDFLDYITATLWLYEQPEEPDPLMQSAFSPMVKLTLSTDIFETQFNGFLYTILSKYEKESLEERNPKYAQILQNLSEDLLFTKLLEQEVWIKSRTNVEGLAEVFVSNKNKYTLEQEAFKGFIVFARNENTVLEVEKLCESEQLTAKELKKRYNVNGLAIQVEEGLWRKGDNQYVDGKIENRKIKSSLRHFPFYTVIGGYITEPEELSDVRLQVEKDYQDLLEQELMSTLKDKYKVTINNTVIKNIK